MSSDVEKALADSGVTVRQADVGDRVAGVRPRWVALPETTEEIAAVMRVAAEHDLAVVPVGGGTKLHWAHPPERCDLLIDTCCLNEVLEHAAGDLVARVQAGVTLESLAETLAAKGQELALDVPVDGTTVGGLLATGIAGPRRFRYGTARDLLIGITVVLADGTIAKSGGKVVKNVAGYDLGKLYTGSYGTLGVIAEATFRLHPLPAERRWVLASFDRPVTETDDVRTNEAGQTFTTTSTGLATDLHGIVTSVAESQVEPSAIELDWPGVTGPCTLAVLVEGTAAEERARAVRDLMEKAAGGEVRIEAEAPPWWGRLPGPPGPPGRAAQSPDRTAARPGRLDADSGPPDTEQGPPDANAGQIDADAGEIDADAAEVDYLLLEVRNVSSQLPGSFVAPFSAAEDVETHAAVRGSLASGVLHVTLPPGTTSGTAAGFVSELRAGIGDAGRVVVLAAPDEIGRRVDRWGHVGALKLMRRVKERFDPDRRMSPGRFVGGI